MKLSFAKEKKCSIPVVSYADDFSEYEPFNGEFLLSDAYTKTVMADVTRDMLALPRGIAKFYELRTRGLVEMQARKSSQQGGGLTAPCVVPLGYISDRVTEQMHFFFLGMPLADMHMPVSLAYGPFRSEDHLRRAIAFVYETGRLRGIPCAGIVDTEGPFSAQFLNKRVAHGQKFS